MSFEIINPASLASPRGWNHGMLSAAGGRVLFVAGMTATATDGRVPAGLDFLSQWDLVLGHILDVLHQAGAGPEHVGRMTVFVADMDAYRVGRRDLRGVWKKHMGDHYPAMALVQVAGFVDPNAQIEIETTAVIPA